MKIPTHNVVHTAIPTHDKALAKNFYSEILGGTVAREYDDRVTFELFDHQLVCHLDDRYTPNEEDLKNPLLNVYPRHFGMTFLSEHDLRHVHDRLSKANVPHLQPVTERFPDLPEKHLTFFVADPSLNIVEFKWYSDPQFIY